MSDSAIQSRLQAVIAAALPDWGDRSENPAPVMEANLPAFGVAVEIESAVPLSMSSPLEQITASVLIVAFVKGSDPRSVAKSARDEIHAAVRAAGDLGGLVFSGPSLASSAIELAAGEGRMARADLRYSINFIA